MAVEFQLQIDYLKNEMAPKDQQAQQAHREPQESADRRDLKVCPDYPEK